MDPQANTTTEPQLFASLFDYAGLFPPAGLAMDNVVRNFAEYQRGTHCSMLNTLVVPAGRLQEFADCVDALPADLKGSTWRLSVLSSRWEDDGPLVHQFQQSCPSADVVSIETKAQADASAILKSIKTVYVELPTDSEFDRVMAELKQLGAFAKIRTGGLVADAFPSCDRVAAFIVACVQNSVEFKATAGLHHPIHSQRATCDKADAPVVAMHGFVNVIAAGASAQDGASIADVSAQLSQTESAEFAASVLNNNLSLIHI